VSARRKVSGRVRARPRARRALRDSRPDAIVLSFRAPPRGERRDLGAPAVVWNLAAYRVQVAELGPPEAA
jgi:hypothetical protein